MSTTYKKLQYNGYDAAVEVAIKDSNGDNIATSLSAMNTAISGKQNTITSSDTIDINSCLTEYRPYAAQDAIDATKQDIISGGNGINVSNNTVSIKNNLSNNVKITISSGDPSGGSDGDIGFKY